MYQYRNNQIITKIFFLFLCTVTVFYSIEIILFQLSGFGHLGNDYIGFYYNELVLGPIIFHYINLFPIFYDYSINLPEFICILILFSFSCFFSAFYISYYDAMHYNNRMLSLLLSVSFCRILLCMLLFQDMYML